MGELIGLRRRLCVHDLLEVSPRYLLRTIQTNCVLELLACGEGTLTVVDLKDYWETLDESFFTLRRHSVLQIGPQSHTDNHLVQSH